ncbi:hypothetical protein CLU96_2686 [Chryseobacterium sp. 52]|uniref:hypothetical protein n=1 Tax=Chryseobacterium sp. 52 TaxID=2035213 RepID=UPI000C4AF138|nr:hypothetical protein [Chryseobacterium sp. 52]PIF45677.1 hypothetical protein CLU96_2686 [Chryseobacterium sp. 52]
MKNKAYAYLLCKSSHAIKKNRLRKSTLFILKLIILMLISSVSIISVKAQDNDGDGILNIADFDDDNDGIPDNVECATTNTVTNGTFTGNINGWTVSSSWQYSSNFAFTETDNVSNVTISQSLNNLTRTNTIIPLTLTLGAGDGSNSLGGTGSLRILLNGIVYATINNSTVRTVGVNNVTISLANGATSNFVPYSTASMPGFTLQTFTLNIPNGAVPDTAVLQFSATADADDWSLDDISVPVFTCDTDGDTIPDYLDFDSDNDGCPDSIEGDENVKYPQLNANGSINITANGGINGNGIPNLVNSGGVADIGADTGQGIGSSKSSAVNACLCYKPSVTSGTILNTQYGITSLGRAGINSGNWPIVRKGGWVALEAKAKGFVPNRLTTAQKNALTPVEGMLVYDTNLDCLSIYDGTSWKCFNTQTCPDVL